MATHTFLTSMSNATDVLFRKWVGSFVDALLAVGMVQTADTGQMNPATATAPAAGNAKTGFVVLRFDDALQATAPIYVRLDFGSGAGGATAPAVWLTIGKGSNGAGIISGVLLAETQIGRVTGALHVTTTEYTGLAAGGPGFVALMPFANDETTTGIRCFYLLIERTRDATGTATGDGLTVLFDTYGNGGHTLVLAAYMAHVYTINYATGAYFLQAPPVTGPYSINGAVAGPSTSLAAGGIGPVFPWVLMAPAIAPWQSCVIVSIPSGDFPGGDFETTLCGNAATFRPIAASDTYSGFGISLQPGQSSVTARKYFGPAIRWE